MNLLVEKYPSPVLRQVCAQVTDFGDFTQHLAYILSAALERTPGYGLAAPQIRELWRMILIQEPGYQPFFMVNPRIVKGKGSVATLEGCLSIPDFRGRVERASSIRVEYQHLNGKPNARTCKDDLAIVVQHEIDHLDGILYVDKLEPADLLRWQMRLSPYFTVPAAAPHREKGESQCQ